jgi:hypothetical protein
MRVLVKLPRTRTSTTTKNEKKNDDNLVILLVLELGLENQEFVMDDTEYSIEDEVDWGGTTMKTKSSWTM